MKRIPELDGLRGLAILAVLVFHARWVFATTAEIPGFAYQILGLGWCGVDLFFVLSGFLITGILLDTRESPTYFRTFYLRRVLRIFPLYFVYLLTVLVLFRYGWRWYSGRDFWQTTNPWWYLGYLMNWKQGGGSDDRFLEHLWSLGIEEQFYLVWPALVWWLPRRRLVCLCGAMMLGALAVRCWMSGLGTDTEIMYRMTPCRLDCLAAGAFVALGMRDFRSLLDRCAGWISVLCAVAFIGVAIASPDNVWSDLPMRTAGASILAVGFACLVFYAASGRRHRILSSRLLGVFGKYSYGIYVLHAVPLYLTVFDLRAWSGGAGVLAIKYLYIPAITATGLGLAWLSWRFLEAPFLALRHDDRRAIDGIAFDRQQRFVGLVERENSGPRFQANGARDREKVASVGARHVRDTADLPLAP